VLIAFLLVGFAIYAPALNGKLIWDDHYLVGQNPLFRSPVFAGEVFRHYLFFESFSTYYRPVQNLSYMLDYWLWAGSPTGYHVTNVVLHVLAAWMLFLLLKRLLNALSGGGRGAGWIALFVSSAWLVHPVHNAAVAYISGRADSLAALLALGAWVLWIEAGRFKSRLARAAAFTGASLALLAALCSKEIALVWLALFAAHLIFFTRGISQVRRFASLGGLAFVLGIYAFLHSLPAARAAAEGAAPEPFANRLVLMFRALGDYTGLMLAPVRLTMERSLDSAGGFLLALGVASLAAGLWLCLRRGEGRSLRRFGALWFGVAFLPISNLIPLNAHVAEHWIYTASIGFLLFLAGAFVMLRRPARRWVAVFAGCAIVLLAIRTGFRAADWRDPLTFARKTIACGGGSPRLLLYVGEELGMAGHLVEQEAICRKILGIYPGITTARIHLGVNLLKQGRVEEAHALLNPERTADVVPDAPRTWNAALNLAGQAHKEGRSDEALALVREWRRRFRETWELAAYEAIVLRDTGRLREALAVVGEYAGGHWWHLPAQLGLASLQRESGDHEAALATARRAQRLDVHGAEAFDEAARNELALNRPLAALESAAEAITRAPGEPLYLDSFSMILHALGREREAQAVLRKAAGIAAEKERGLL
jgi:tetratricopeptide (TPR) repeat protein